MLSIKIAGTVFAATLLLSIGATPAFALTHLRTIQVGSAYKADGSTSPDAYSMVGIITADNRYIITQGPNPNHSVSNNIIYKVDLQTGQVVETAVPFGSQMYDMQLSADGRKIVFGNSMDGYDVFLVNVDPLSLDRRLSRHDQRVVGVNFLPDNKGVLSTSPMVSQIFRWDIATSSRLWQIDQQQSYPVPSPDGQIFATSYVTDIQLRRVSDGSLIRNLNHQGFDSSWGAIAHHDFSADGQRMVTVGTLGDIKLWNVNTGTLLGTWHVGGKLQKVTLLGNGTHAVVTNREGNSLIFNLETGQIEATFVASWGHYVSQDEQYLATFQPSGGTINVYRIFDTRYDATPPSSPQSINYSTQGSDVLISWQPASDSQSGVKFYRIYRGSPGTETYYTQVGAITSWVDVGAAGNGYSYKVTAVNGNGLESPLASQDPMPSLTPTQSEPTSTPTPSPACRADVNGNGTVEIGDISGILFYWGQSCAANMSACQADVNGNATVEVGDIAGTLFYWGQVCLPASGG